MSGQPLEPRRAEEITDQAVDARAARVQPGRLAGHQHPGAVVMAGTSPEPRAVRNKWLLPDDGIIDELAVEIAASGQRVVRLTRAERRAAAARITAAGGNAYTIAKRLRMQYAAACVLGASIAETEGAT